MAASSDSPPDFTPSAAIATPLGIWISLEFTGAGTAKAGTRDEKTQLRMKNRQTQPAQTRRFTDARRNGKQSLPRCARGALRGFRPALVSVSKPLQNRANNQRQRHRSIIQNFREPPAFLQRHKLPPRNR